MKIKLDCYDLATVINCLKSMRRQYDSEINSNICNIENLESECNTKIFKRTNKGCVLTKEGELVYQFAKNTLDNYVSITKISMFILLMCTKVVFVLQ